MTKKEQLLSSQKQLLGKKYTLNLNSNNSNFNHIIA